MTVLCCMLHVALAAVAVWYWLSTQEREKETFSGSLGLFECSCNHSLFWSFSLGCLSKVCCSSQDNKNFFHFLIFITYIKGICCSKIVVPGNTLKTPSTIHPHPHPVLLAKQITKI